MSRSTHKMSWDWTDRSRQAALDPRLSGAYDDDGGRQPEAREALRALFTELNRVVHDDSLMALLTLEDVTAVGEIAGRAAAKCARLAQIRYDQAPAVVAHKKIRGI